MLRHGGKAWIAVHEGDGRCEGTQTRDGWQANQPTEAFLSDARRFFGRAEVVVLRRVKAIQCTLPRADQLLADAIYR